MKLEQQIKSLLGARAATGEAAVAGPVGGAVERRGLLAGLVLVSLVAALSVTLTAQGWRSRVPAFDMIAHIHNTYNLITAGVLPQQGDTGSYGSFKPPGTAWLMVPSALLFPDVRAIEYAGTAVLHFATLLGIFLLARRTFGTWCACLAVVAYGISANGLFLAGSLWPNGRPDFYVWTVLLAYLWVTRRDARLLAGALLVWATGMYVDMGIAPVFFVLVALWLAFRPPVRARPLLVALVCSLVIWSPYLSLQLTRGFADIRSQLLLQNIFPADFRQVWCNPDAQILTWAEPAGAPGAAGTGSAWWSDLPPPAGALLALGGELREKLLYNFEVAAVFAWLSPVLLALTVASLVLLTMPRSAVEAAGRLTLRDVPRDRLTRGAGGLVLGGVLLYAVVAVGDRFGVTATPFLLMVRKVYKLLVLGGAMLLVGRWSVTAAAHLLSRRKLVLIAEAQALRGRLLAICLIVPWFILLVVAEPGKPERFWSIWPLQAIFLAACFTNLLPRLGVARAWIWAAQLLLVVALFGNSFLLHRVTAWRHSGWAGADAYEIALVDYIAGQLDAEGRHEASIGYNIFIFPFMASYHITNPQYKVGSEIDLLFRYRHGILNTNSCAEGAAPDDEYRIVRTTPMAETWAPRAYFDLPLPAAFRLERRFGPYEVYRRAPVGTADGRTIRP